MAECRFRPPKTSEEEINFGGSALFRGNVCIWSDKISNVSAILGRKSTARLKVNQNTRSPPLSENLKSAFLFWVD